MNQKKPSFKDILTVVPENKRLLLPKGFQRIGDIAVLNLKPEVMDYGETIGKLILKNFPYIRSVCVKTDRISGEFREPSIRVVAGDKNTVTLHRENHCIFKIDVSKLMFSKGNLYERGRIPKLVKAGEIIVDMFAGIGYFSIPIAKLSQAKKVYSIEKNPVAYSFLLENIKLNRVEKKIIPILGDCRKVSIPDKADRVLMGYLPETHKYLPFAFRFLKTKGIIHYHDIFHRKELWNKPEKILHEYAEKSGFEVVCIAYKRKVKSYAPNIFHVSMDVEVRTIR